MGFLTLWGLLLALKTIFMGMCFGTGFYVKDALINYIRERKHEIELNLETGLDWNFNAQRKISSDWRAQHLPGLVNLFKKDTTKVISGVSGLAQ